MSASMAEKLQQLVAAEMGRLRGISEEEASEKPAPEKWSRKEMLGHLIDSASNNHQRFVRALNEDELVYPAYAQNEWVKSQAYNREEWSSLVDLWQAINLHLAHIIKGVPPEKLPVPCRIGSNPPVTLEALIADYLRHMEHHLEKI